VLPELSKHQPSRIKGKPALVRRLRGLLVAVQRFSLHRASTEADRWWSARTLDALTAALSVATEDNNHDRGLKKLHRSMSGNRTPLTRERERSPLTLGGGNEAAERT